MNAGVKISLLEVIKSQVKLKSRHRKGGKTHGERYNILINLILDSIFRPYSDRKEMSQNPGGHVVPDAELISTGLACEHMFPGPTIQIGCVLRTKMNGTLACWIPLVGYYGVILQTNRKAYIGETIVVVIKSKKFIGGMHQVP